MKLIIILWLALQAVAVRAEVEPDFRIAVVAPFASVLKQIAHDAVDGAKFGLKPGAQRLTSWKGTTKTNFNVNVEFFDDRANPKSAEEVARTIVAHGGYHAVVGGINSGTAIPAAKIYEEAGLINISLGATNPLLTRSGHRWTFRMSMDDHQLARSTYVALIHRFRDLRTLFVHDGTAYGEYTAEGFASVHMITTGQVATLQNLGESGDINLSSVQGTSDDEAVLFVGGMDLFATKVLRKLPRKTRWTIVGGDGICTEHMAKEVMQLGMNLVCASQERKDTVPVNQEFEAAFQSQFGRTPSSTAAAAADAAALLIESFGLHGHLGKEQVRDFLRSGARFRGFEVPISFDAQGDNSLAQAYLYEAEKGVLRFTQKIR